MLNLQKTINELVQIILEYKSDTWSSSANNLTKEQAEKIAASLITDLVIAEIDWLTIAECQKEMEKNAIKDKEFNL